MDVAEGVREILVASNWTRIRPLPGFASRTFQPSSFAAGGGGISPRRPPRRGFRHRSCHLLPPPNGSRLSCGRACTTLAPTGDRRRSCPGPTAAGQGCRTPPTGRRPQPLVAGGKHAYGTLRSNLAWKNSSVRQSTSAEISREGCRLLERSDSRGLDGIVRRFGVDLLELARPLEADIEEDRR